MRIGLTYDLKTDYLAAGWSEEEAAEFDSEATIAGLEETLRELGHEVARIGSCQKLAGELVSGRRWDIVFNIAEGVHGRSREAQVPALLECFGIPYTFCDPLTAALTLDKAVAKRLVRDAGLRTGDFAVVESREDVELIKLPLPLFVKPCWEGTGKGINSDSIVHDRQQLERTCAHLLSRFQQPVLVEEFLPGPEVTVGVVGTDKQARVLGVMEVLLSEQAEPGAYSYNNKHLYEERVAYRLVEPGAFRGQAERLALTCYRVLGCRDAGRVDLRADAAGRPCFLEVNPLAGLHPVDSDLSILNRLAGRDYRDLIADILSSAMSRVQGARASVL